MPALPEVAGELSMYNVRNPSMSCIVIIVVQHPEVFCVLCELNTSAEIIRLISCGTVENVKTARCLGYYHIIDAAWRGNMHVLYHKWSCKDAYRIKVAIF